MRILIQALLLCFALVQGCGQTGPLYMPEDAPTEDAGEPAGDN